VWSETHLLVLVLHQNHHRRVEVGHVPVQGPQTDAMHVSAVDEDPVMADGLRGKMVSQLQHTKSSKRKDTPELAAGAHY